jgi:ZU5 domain
MLLSACGGSSSEVATQSIGASGGTVSTSGGASVQIPAAALAATTTITASATPSAATPSGATLVGTPVTFGPEGQQFTTPVTVTLPLTPSELPSGKSAASVVIFTAPAGSTSYTQLTTSVVDATHVSAQVAHFSTFLPGIVTGGGPCATNADCNGNSICVQGICE